MGTPTATVRLTKPAVGGDTGPIWPNAIDLNFDLIDRAFNQTTSVTIPDTNVNVTADGSAVDQALYAKMTFIGALSSDRFATLPNCMRIGYAINNTTGGHNVILTTGIGSTAVLAPGGARYQYEVDAAGNVSIPFVTLGNVTISGVLTTSNFASTGGISANTFNVTASPNFSLGPSGGLPTLMLSTGNFLANTSLGLNLASTQTITLNGTGVILNAPLTVSGATPLSGVGTVITPSGGMSAPSTGWTVGVGINSGANGVIGGFIIANSDERLKRDIADISDDDALNWVTLADPKTFTMDGRRSAGFIAQDDAQTVRAQAVYKVPDLRFDDGRHAIDYNQHIAYLTKALQVAIERIEALEEQCG